MENMFHKIIFIRKSKKYLNNRKEKLFSFVYLKFFKIKYFDFKKLRFAAALKINFSFCEAS